MTVPHYSGYQKIMVGIEAYTKSSESCIHGIACGSAVNLGKQYTNWNCIGFGVNALYIVVDNPQYSDR